MAVVQRDGSCRASAGSEALAPEESRARGLAKPQRAGRQAVAAMAMQVPEQARKDAPGVIEALAPAENLPAFAQRYVDWNTEHLRSEAAVLKQRVQTLAQARCALLLGTSEATDDQGDAPAGVYARGDGKRYRLPESDHADLYDLLTEAQWLRQRAASR